MSNPIIQPGQSLVYLNFLGERTLSIGYAGQEPSTVMRIRPDGTNDTTSAVFPKADTWVSIWLYPDGNIKQYESQKADGSHVNIIFAQPAQGAEKTFGPDSRFTHGEVTFISTETAEGAVTEKTFDDGMLTDYSLTSGTFSLIANYNTQNNGASIHLTTAAHDIVQTGAGTINRLIGLDGGSLIGQDGASLIGQDGASLIGQDGASLIGQDGASLNQLSVLSLIGQDGGSLIGQDGATLFDIGGGSASMLSSAWSIQGGSLIASGSASLIGQDGATFAGNLISTFRGYSLLSTTSLNPTQGTSGNDILTGGGGNETFYTGTGADTVFGNGGDDRAVFGDISKTYPFDNFDGGSGTDTLVIDFSSATNRVIYRTGVENSPKIGVADSYLVVGSAGGERVFFKNVEQFEITGSNYNDELRGGSGKDILLGGGGDDLFRAGPGDVVNGGSGNDHVILTMTQVSALTAAARAAAATEQGWTMADGTKLISIEAISVEAGNGNDVYNLIGTRTSGTGPGIFSGNGGDDTFKVDLPNSDTAYFNGGSGDDLLVMDWSAATTDITFYEGNGAAGQLGYRADKYAGSTTQYVLDYREVERFELYGGSGDDTLRGSTGNDKADAGTGRDEVDLGKGTDTLVVDWDLVARDNYSGTSSIPYHSALNTNYDPTQFMGTRLTGSLATGYSGAFGFWADDYNVSNNTDDRIDFKGIENFNLTLGKGRDHVATGDGDDIIVGNGGSDWYITGKGFDQIDAGNGYDVRWEADKSAANAMLIDLNQETFSYTIGNRTALIKGVDLLGSDANHRFRTGAGNDFIVTQDFGAADYINTGAGNDLVKARGGLDYIDMGTGSDTLVVDYAGFSYDPVAFASFAGSLSAGYSGRLNLGTQGGVVFAGVENFDIRLAQDSRDNSIKTGSGNDSVSVLRGTATVDLGAGTDRLIIDWSDVGYQVTGSALTGSASKGYSGSIDTPASGGYGGKVTFKGVESFDIKLGFGDDELRNGWGSDNFDGGQGIDLLRYSGKMSSYDIKTLNGVTTITRDGVADTVRNFEEIRFDNGSYVLGDIQSADRKTRGELAVGTTTSAVIDYSKRYTGDLGDQDWFAVNLTAGKTYEFVMNAASGSSVNPYIAGLYQLGGAFAGTVDDNSGGGVNAKITFTASSSGVYYIALTGGGSTTGAYTITAREATPPTITSLAGGDTASIAMAENGTAVAQVKATDPDAGAEITYTIAGGADASKFTINAKTGALSFKTAPNFELPTDTGKNNVYDVVVKAADQSGLSDTQAIAVTVTNVNEAPAIVSAGAGATAAVSVAENGTAVMTVTAVDPDVGAKVTYTIAGGADASMFTIDAKTGALAFKSAPNFELKADANGNGVYDVVVKAADQSGLFDTQALAVTVTNINEAPTITSNGGGATAAISFAENGTAVTKVAATDVDAGSKIVYAISGGADASKFTIDAKTGALAFKTAPDFELPTDAGKNNVYDVIVRASDGTLSDTQSIAVKVTDVKGITKTGTASNDTINGTIEADTLSGGAGNDTIKGLSGADKIAGGTGRDMLYGGVDTAKDIFVFLKGDTGSTSASADQIFDFRSGIDKIDLSGIDADPAKGVQDLRFVTDFALPTKTQADGQFRIVDEGANVSIYIDYDGNNTTDAMIKVVNVGSLVFSDFIL